MIRPPALPRGRNGYCGPFAVATALGCTTDQAAGALNTAAGRRVVPVAGVYGYQVRDVLRRYAPRFYEAPVTGQPTLINWARANATKFGDAVAIVTVTGHYVTMWRGLLADTKQVNRKLNHVWVEPSSFRGKNARVQQVLIVPAEHRRTPRVRRPAPVDMALAATPGPGPEEPTP